MIRLLILGAGGMTGGELAARAPGAGFHCTALDRKALDITDESGVMLAVEAARPDVVVNAAAYTAVDRAETERETATSINAGGARNVARAAEALRAALVHISTDYVFDGSGSIPYKPSDTANPVGVYAESKTAGEEAVRAAGRHAIVRTSWVFSHRGRNFVRTMVNKASGGGKVRVVSDQTGRPTCAGDLADALLVVATSLHEQKSLSGTWHFANEGATTWYDLARAIFELRRVPLHRVTPVLSSEYPTAARRPAFSVLDTTSFQETFGVIPRPWRQPLRETLELIG